MSETSARSIVPSRTETLPSFPQDKMFLPNMGKNKTWNDLLERFYRIAEARGPLDLKTINESDWELGAWVLRQKSK